MKKLFYPTRERVILNTKSGRAFRGVLWAYHRRFAILKAAELLNPGGQLVPVDGEVIVPKEEIEFIQVLP